MGLQASVCVWPGMCTCVHLQTALLQPCKHTHNCNSGGGDPTLPCKTHHAVQLYPTHDTC